MLRLSLLVLRLETLAGALSTYATAVENIATRAQPHRNTLTTCMPSTSESWEDQMKANTKLAALAEERSSADSTLATALTTSNTEPSSALRDLAEAAGITDLAELANIDLNELMANSAMEPDELTDAEWLLLKDYLVDHQYDTEAMDRFFTSLGGEATLDLFTAACQHFDQSTAYSFATTLRSGLSTGSTGWPAQTAERFQTELTTRLLDLDPYSQQQTVQGQTALNDLLALNFLLDDPNNAPMGAELASAIATWVDAIERGPNAPAPWQVNLPAKLLASSTNIGLFVSPSTSSDQPSYELAMEEIYGNVCVDLGGAALRALSAYPDYALAWLTDATETGTESTLGGDRLTYWVQDRDYTSTGEGFTGITALWESAQRATGGQLDPDSVDLTVWDSIATITTFIATKLTDRDDFVVENLSANAVDYLARSVSAMLPFYAEVPVTSRPGNGTYGQFQFEESILYDGERPIPAISPAAFAELLGMAVKGNGGSGATVVNEGIDRYYAAVQNGVESGSINSSTAMTYIAKLQGELDGSSVGTALAQARRRDIQDATDNQILSGAVSISLSFVSFGCGAVADAALSYTVGAVFDSIIEPQSTAYETLLDQYLSTGEDNDAEYARANLLSYVSHFHDQLIADGIIDGSQDSIDNYIDDLMSDYENAGGRSTWNAVNG